MPLSPSCRACALKVPTSLLYRTVDYLHRHHELPWLGVYIHFIYGVFGLVLLGSLRASIVLGPRLCRPVLCIVAASTLRMCAAVNRGPVVRGFGVSSFWALCGYYYRRFNTHALTTGSLSEILSIIFIVAGVGEGLRQLVQRFSHRD